MKNKSIYASLILASFTLATSCKKDNVTSTDEAITPYTVPATYAFTTTDFVKSNQRVRMSAELNTYVGTANNATITATKAADYFDNKNAAFTSDAALNTSGVTLAEKTADADLFRGYFATQAANSLKNATPAVNGSAGIIVSGTTKRLVGAEGLEYNQAIVKGMMGALFFKEATTILNTVATADNKTVTNGLTAMQRNWDEAFGNLGVPIDYDTTKTYVNTDPLRPLLWGGYLAERGKPIKAGGIIFEAFRKGRAAIGGKDYKVVAEQAVIIQDKWEQLAAAAALEYSTIPTRSTSVGNLATQFHALSEGFGFIYSLKYRSAHSKLSAADYATLQSVFATNFYTLVNEPGFAKLVQAQTILKATYALNY